MAQLSTEFNETDFAEYDPTPYGGGYDIAATYGAPLAPSVSTCYPHSLSKPSNGSSEDPVNKSHEVVQAISSSHDHESGLDQAKPDEDDEEDKKSSSGSNNSNGNRLVDPSLDYLGSDNNFSNGYGVYGSCSRDDLGPCAALFDYWPCLYRKDKMSFCDQQNEVKNSCGNQWESAAVDYLFGGWNHHHGEIRDDVVTYNCQKHCAEEPISVLYDYNEELSQCVVYNHNDQYCPERPVSVQCDYNEESWPHEDTSHYEVYYEEPYLHPNYGEDWYEGYDEHFH
ncbi:hypothetical protein Scep_013739 [Stephania cephalantha]|uniref:Uncharacterized protein n=1 Tax=Stephania cephalantha TaxID=152367 RepID=A0AAP0J1T2_9MAGN